MATEGTEDGYMEEYMEVVTAYKCKFCDVTCSTTQEMGQHVQTVHIQKRISKAIGGGPQMIIVPKSGCIPVTSSTPVLPSNQSIRIEALQPTTKHNITIDALQSTTKSSHHATSENGANVVSSLTGGVSPLETLVTVANNQIIQLDGAYNGTPHMYPNVVEAIPETTPLIPISECQPLSHGQVIAISTDKDGNIFTGDIHALSKADHLGNIQFVSQDSSGQFILQSSEQVQFDNGSTIQVLVQDSCIGQDPDDTQGEVTFQSQQEPEEELDVKEMEIQRSEHLSEIVQGDMHFIIERNNETDDEEHKSRVTTSTSPVDGLETAEEEAGYHQSDVQTEGFEDFDESDITTKELYLCGNCSEGFASIQECKSHMIREHGLSEHQGSGKVDTGTQMEPRKKAGRKRKSEITVSIKEEPEEIAMSDSDEDWSEKLMSSGSLRSQRKRQPPASLREDYYLGRSKKKVPKKRMETGLNVKCSMKGCTARFREEETMKRHLDCHIMEAKGAAPQFRCESCEDKFFFWKQARYHMWKTHKIDMDLLTCEVCDFKTDTFSKLKIHCEIHGAERPYTCDVCGRGYKQFAQMKNHQISHSPALRNYMSNMSASMADKWHTPKDCDICARKFANAKCLKKHKETVHSDYKPFKCTYCNHACSRKAMLILHMRTHTGDKPFKCEECSYNCGDHNSLRRHKMRHTGHKPYKCPHCPYACIQAISLKMHVKNKHPGMGGIFNCNICLYRTVSKQQYENHLLDHKNGLIETVETSEGVFVQKNSARARKDKANAGKTGITTITLQNDLLQVLQSQTVQMHNVTMPGSQVVQIPVSGINNAEQQVTQLEVQMNNEGENVISAEDLAKLTNYDGLVHSDVAAAQLIYSALSAISQNTQPAMDVNSQGVEAEVENGDIQTSIQTDSKEGVTTHTITFHLPDGEQLGGEVTLEEHEVQKGVTVVEVDEGVTDWQANTVAEQGES